MQTQTPPAAAPVRFEEMICAASHCQLVVIDIQQKLAAAMPAKVINRVVQNTRLLLQAARLLGIPVLVTEQYPQGLGATDASVAELLPPDHAPMEKTSFSGLDLPAFRERATANLRPQVVMCGMEAHVCVLQTAIEMQAAGWQVFVVEDGVCSRRLENYQNSLERLRQAAVQVTNAESVVFEWIRHSRHEHFKEVAGLLR